jgi:hypothetical protein
MDPAQKKWLKNLAIHIESNFGNSLKKNAKILIYNIKLDKFVYKLLHSSGIVFGYPEDFIFTPHPHSTEWTEEDKAKVIITESLIASYLYFNRNKIYSKRKIELSIIYEAFESIIEFYKQFNIIEQNKLPLKKKKEYSADALLEKIIDKRIRTRKNISTIFKTNTSFNYYTFIDIILYSEWLLGCNYKLIDKFYEIQYSLLKSISLYKSQESSEKYTMFYNLYNISARSNVSIKKLNEIKNVKLRIENEQFLQNNNFTTKAIIFEFGIFPLYIEHEISNKEIVFIDKLAQSLKIDKTQKDLSLLMVNSFILKNIEKISYLKFKNSIDIISYNINNRLRTIIIKNKGKLSREIAESRELVELLLKSKNEGLTSEEKEKVKEQLTDIFLRTIPSVAIFMIPGGSILLPLILKILPEEILIPSSFRNK